MKCEGCEKTVKRKGARYCTAVCREKHYASMGYGPIGFDKSLCAGTRGAIGELRVCADLLSKGYEVFRAVSPACSCDLVIAKNGNLLTVEVRTGFRTKIGYYYGQPVRAKQVAVVLPNEIVYLPALERE